MYEEAPGMDKKGFAVSFASPAEVVAFVGDSFVESKLFILTKTSGGITKNRILLGCRKSKVSTTSIKAERVPLPRVRDVVFHALQLLAVGHAWDSDTTVCLHTTADNCVEELVLDVSDAFWSIPSDPSERKFFVC